MEYYIVFFVVVRRAEEAFSLDGCCAWAVGVRDGGARTQQFRLVLVLVCGCCCRLKKLAAHTPSDFTHIPPRACSSYLPVCSLLSFSLSRRCCTAGEKRACACAS